MDVEQETVAERIAGVRCDAPPPEPLTRATIYGNVPYASGLMLQRPCERGRMSILHVPSRVRAAMLLTVMVGSLAACAADDSASKAIDPSTERKAAESFSRGVQVRNNTDRPVTLRISGTDNNDWESRRPDGDTGLLEGQQIAPGTVLQAWLTVNTWSKSSPFTINVEGLDTSLSVELDSDLEHIQDNDDDLWWGFKKRHEAGCYEVWVKEGEGERVGYHKLTWTVRSGGYALEVVERCVASSWGDNTIVTISGS